MWGYNRLSIVVTALALLSACATPVPDDPELATIDTRHLPSPDLTLDIDGLSPCTTSPDNTLHLNSRQPVTVIVHGCFASAARFRALSQVFAFHGQQSVCFNYDDRDSLDKSAAELTAALEQLEAALENHKLTIIGHSQGGLIARRALSERAVKPWRVDTESVELVTISSPFGGIAAADHCASTTARWISLGLVMPICKLISGDKWYEITRPSPFIQQPGGLLPQVQRHVKIVTDENNTCRRYGDEGRCVEDDFVFSVAEQYFERVDGAKQVDNVEVAAGHAEIVGDYRVAPRKLIALLQRKGVMRNTEAKRLRELETLLAHLYYK